MNFGGSKLVLIATVGLLLVAPFVVWGALRLAARNPKRDLRPLLPWLKGFRWLAWSCGLLPYGAYFLGDHIPWAYAAAAVTFSIGLSFPERWLKEHSASPSSTT